MWKQNNMIGKINKHLFAEKKTGFNQCKETVYYKTNYYWCILK